MKDVSQFLQVKEQFFVTKFDREFKQQIKVKILLISIAPLVQWYHARFPFLRPGFDSRAAQLGILLSGRAIGCSPIDPWFKSECPLILFSNETKSSCPFCSLQNTLLCQYDYETPFRASITVQIMAPLPSPSAELWKTPVRSYTLAACLCDCKFVVFLCIHCVVDSKVQVNVQRLGYFHSF